LQKMTVITLSSLHFVIPTSIGAIGVTNMWLSFVVVRYTQENDTVYNQNISL
jgi:hypothetical protein